MVWPGQAADRCAATPGGDRMMQGMGAMGMMAKMPAMCMAFMVTVPALLGLGVGFAIGRGTKSR